MALDVVVTPIPSHVVVEILDLLDRRGETYQFLASSDANLPLHNRPLDLHLFRDGSDDPLTIKLNMDGTWTAVNMIVVGEQR